MFVTFCYHQPTQRLTVVPQKLQWQQMINLSLRTYLFTGCKLHKKIREFNVEFEHESLFTFYAQHKQLPIINHCCTGYIYNVLFVFYLFSHLISFILPKTCIELSYYNPILVLIIICGFAYMYFTL